MREVKDVIIIAIRGSSVATNMGVAQKSRRTATQKKTEMMCLLLSANDIEVNRIGSDLNQSLTLLAKNQNSNVCTYLVCKNAFYSRVVTFWYCNTCFTQCCFIRVLTTLCKKKTTHNAHRCIKSFSWKNHVLKKLCKS